MEKRCVGWSVSEYGVAPGKMKMRLSKIERSRSVLVKRDPRPGQTGQLLKRKPPIVKQMDGLRLTCPNHPGPLKKSPDVAASNVYIILTSYYTITRSNPYWLRLGRH
jgi:hypothetical protein